MVKETDEGRLTEAFDTLCVEHHYPKVLGVNGVHNVGWNHIPDRVFGHPEDDICTKSILIEIKPTKEGARKDLEKEEYKKVKHLAIIYFDNGNKYGSLYKWTRTFALKEIITLPLKEFLAHLLIVYHKEKNPITIEFGEKVRELEQWGYKSNVIFNVISGSFTGDSSKETRYHLCLFRKWLDAKFKNTEDKTKALHDYVFSEDTYEKRYTWGQFITEYPHYLHVAEEVIKIFDQHQDLTIYEPCAGSGAIAEQLLHLLFNKYGKKRAREIMKNQLRFADIDLTMRRYAYVVLYLKTEELFGQGQGIRFTIEDSNLEVNDKKDFDLSKMIVYGNYPFNKGNDYNYLARILHQQEKSGLQYGVFILSTSTIDPHKFQTRKILGDDFYKYIEEFYPEDKDTYGVPVSFIKYEKKCIERVNKGSGLNSITLEDFKLEFSMLPGFNKTYSFRDGKKIFNTFKENSNSIWFAHQKDLNSDKNIAFRIPSPDASEKSQEYAIYLKWMEEVKEYPVIEYFPFQLLLGKLITEEKKEVAFRLFKDSKICGLHTIIRVIGEVSKLSILALILTSNVFKTKLYMLFPKELTGYGLRVNILKTLPIPKNIPERLYEIGQILIIENKEDEVLRKEADEIIKNLYKDLKI